MLIQTYLKESDKTVYWKGLRKVENNLKCSDRL